MKVRQLARNPLSAALDRPLRKSAPLLSRRWTQIRPGQFRLEIGRDSLTV